MLNSGNKVRSGNTIAASDMLELPQCLPLDPITLESQKYSNTGELRRVLGVPLTGLSRDHSLGVPQLKPIAPSASGELKHFKESVQKASRKARDRAEQFKDSIVKLDKYKEALNSKKRKKGETIERSGVLRSAKVGTQSPKIPRQTVTHGSDEKYENVMMTKRIRTSLSNIQMEDNSTVIQLAKNDQDIGNLTTSDNVRIEEKTRRLLAGGEGLDQKVKKKRSVGAVYNRDITGDGKKKHIVHPNLSTDTKLRLCDNHGIRLKSMSRVGGIKRGNDQKSGTLAREKMTAANLRAIVKISDRSNAQEDFPPSNPNLIVKGKVSGASRASSSMDLDSSVHSPSGAFSGTSIQPMTQWIGQRPHKSSRSRRAILLPPISRKLEVHGSSQGTPTFDSFVQATTSEHACTVVDNVEEFNKESNITSTTSQLPESAESGGRETETREIGTCSSRSEQTTRSFGASTFRMRKNKTIGSGNGVEELAKTGMDSSSCKAVITPIKEKLGNLPLAKPQRSTKPSDKGRSRSGRPPVIKQGPKFHTLVGQKLHDHPDLTGKFDDDREELVLAANSACTSRNLACSGPLWNKLEPLFAPVSQDDASYLRKQLGFAEMCEYPFQKSNTDDCILGITQSLGKTESDHLMEVSTKGDALSEKSTTERLEKATPLYRRVLSALIEEDEAAETCHFGETRNMPLQCTSDDSFCGSCNQIDIELKERDRMDSEVESDVDLQNQKIYLDRLSCDRSVSSNTIRNPNMSSSLQSTGVWHGDDECSHSEITYNSEICSYDFGQVQTADSNLPGFSAVEVQPPLISMENRLLLELHSIGLYPETLPDLLDGDEAINEDIIELQNRLHQQIEKKRNTLGKVEKSVEKEQDSEKQRMEQAALDQFIEIAYRRQLACKRSKGAARKVSKQVALDFLKRTLLRCKEYKESGRSCFDEPVLQSILSSPSTVVANDAKSSDCLGSATASNKCIKAFQVKARISATEGHESHGDNLDRRPLESTEGVIGSSELISVHDKEMREVRSMDAIGDSRVSTLDGIKRKRSETDRHQRRDYRKTNALSRANRLPVENGPNERRNNAKLKQKNNHAKNQSRLTESEEPAHPPANRLSQTADNPSNNINVEGKPADDSNSKDAEICRGLGNLSLPGLDTMDELGTGNGLDGHQDLGSWLTLDDDGLTEHDSLGLAIPMDDLSEVLGMN